jgi:glutathionyl-hydroquinone reductase
MMVRAMKGLEDVIGATSVHPTWRRTKPDLEGDTHTGWVFGDPNGKPFPNSNGDGGPFDPAPKGCDPNPLFPSFSVRDVYEKAKDNNGKYTVPILWDKKKETIVSNESSEIIKMLNAEFNEWAKNPDLDLNPAELQDEMATVDEWIYPNLNNGVYRCGFATTQAAYDKAIVELTDAFDKLNGILQKQRYITGDQITLSDVRLFMTLVRFDEVYIVYFKTNTRSVAHTPAILNYCREIYQMEGVRDTISMEQIKQHYFTSHPSLNKFSIIPKGTDFLKLLDEPHDRDGSMQKKALNGVH